MVLTIISDRWKTIALPNEYIARLGGDEFMLLIEGKVRGNALLERISVYNKALSDIVSIGKREYRFSGCFGVALFPENGKNWNELYQRADAAMYHVKRKGRNGVQFFNEILLQQFNNETEIENRLRECLDKGTFHFVYQPQYSIEDRSLRGFETLLRMEDRNGKSISPELFIRIAEKGTLIEKLDNWVLDHAIGEFISASGNTEGLILSVNISARHFQSFELVTHIRDILDKYYYPPYNLEIEITETAFATNFDAVRKNIQTLREMGVHIAIDDFGSGFASLNYISKLPADTLKIDKMFIDDISSDEENNEFVQLIINMGHTLKYRVVAEGTEHERQIDALKKMGCDYVQGFCWGRPMPIGDVKRLLTEQPVQ
jgi:polar amino acid transport system substrate-binding protein